LSCTLIAVVSYQRSFLGGYASGLRSRNQEVIASAFAERDRADQALARARSYVY